MKAVARAAGAPQILHFLDVPDEESGARLHRRNAAGAHDFAVSDGQFDLFTSFFQPPEAAEGMDVVAVA